MKNLLSKTLLCSVLASTFLIVNCQKAPNREAKAKIDPAGKTQALKMGVCSQEVLNEDKILKEKLEAIKVELKKDLSDPDKTALTELVNQFKKQADKLTGEIGKLKAEDKKSNAEGCAVHDGNDPAKKATGVKYMIAEINKSVLTLGKDVKAKTGQENDITKGAAAIVEPLAANQNFKIASAKLAEVLSDEKSADGAVAISAGVIESEAAQAKILLEKKEVTACSLLNITKSEIKAEQTMSILSTVYEKAADATKRNVLKVLFAVKVAADVEASPGAMTLACNIAADKAEADAASEARIALGSLVTKVVSAIPASGDTTPGSGDSTPGSGDSSEAK